MSASADWITGKELMQLTGWSPRTVRRKKAAGELVTRDGEPGRNGKPQLEFDANALDAGLQQKRMQQRIAAGALVKAPGELAKPRGDQPIRALAALEGEALAQAKERLAIIGPMIDFVHNGQKPLAAQQITNLSEIVNHISALQGIGKSTLWNWWKAYRGGGPGMLADRPRKDRNLSRFFEEHREAAEFATNKYWNERLSITMVHESLVREWPRLRAGEMDAPPVYKTTRLFLKSLPPLITETAHFGERRYKEDFAPFLLRDRSKLRANQFWVSDHMIHDVFVRNFDEETGGPYFPELPLNAAFRPWLTAIEDMKSRLIVAMVWCTTPSSNSISSALRFALERYGRPESALYVDNGKDYNKVSDDARGVLTRLGIQTQHCTPRHPQAKEIESFFHILHQRFDVLWRPAYAGTSPKARPEECDKLLDQHKKLVTSGQGDKSRLPMASEFLRAAQYWLDEFNATFIDKARGMGRRTPQQIFDADLPAESREPLKALDVAQLFWEREKRVVREGGTVQLFNARYEPVDAESFAALMLQVKREVLVACDPLNVGEAIALTLDEKPLGVLRSQELLAHGTTSKDEIQASMRERRNVYKAIKQYQGRLAHSRLLKGDSSELEVLAQRAAAAGNRKPVIQARALPMVVNMESPRRLHVDDIVEEFLED